MQQEEAENQGSNTLPDNLTDLLALFLEGPTPEVEYRITSFPIDVYYMILSDKDQAKEIKLACATALKEAVSKRELYQHSAEQILTQVEALYLTCDSEISGSLELVLERIFNMYFDDQKKLAIFERVIDKLTACTDIKASYINQRALKITVLLVRGMDSPTLNNQICIGALFCYLKHLYYDKNKTTDLTNPSGRGLEILIEAMKNDTIPQLQSFIGVQVEVVKMIRDIVDRVEEDESEEPESIPTMYIRNSEEIQRLMSGIICVSPNGKIHSKNEIVNELKANLLQLFAEVYMYHLEKPFLLAALGTITATSALQLRDYSMQILSTLLLLVQRSTSFAQFAQTFFNVTQVLVIKLFEIITAKQAEREAITYDPQYFAEIADDFCKTQQSDTLKARAGSLLYNLCLCIDGNLTFVTNFALISLLDLERKAVLSLMPGVQPDPSTLQSENAMKTLLQLWPYGAEQFTQTSILVLSSISDLLLKRVEFNSAIRRHLHSMQVLFNLRQQTLKFFPILIICRYVQLFSFFSSPNCLDPFLPLYPLNQAIAQTTLKALETMIQFHDKKDDNMRTYVAMISTKVLLLSDKLTPLLQSTIISRPQLLLCVKERLIQKLVVWLLQFLRQGNVFSSNKIANLLCKVLEKYPDYLVHTEEQLYRLELEALTQYISPLYRHLVTSERQEAEECVVDIAVAHCEVLKTSMDLRTAEQFLQIGTIVVKRNNGVLNKCLELFSRLLSLPHAKVIMQKSDFMAIQKIRLMVAGQLLNKCRLWLEAVERRAQNIWQLAYLIQLCLATYEISEEKPGEQVFDLSYLFHLTEAVKSPILTLKTLLMAFLAMNVAPNPVTQKWLLHAPLPQVMPPWQKDHLCIYILRAIKHFKAVNVRARLINYVLTLILPNDKLKKYMQSYEDRIHCISSDQAEVFAAQAAKDVVHPFTCMPIDTYEQFKKMFTNENQWQEIRKLLGPKGDNCIREALSIKKVGSRLRHIVKVKTINLRP